VNMSQSCVIGNLSSGIEPLVGVPPIRQRHTASHWVGGTPYPLHRRGSEFNELAPHTPGRLGVPCFAEARQHQGCRSPPMLKSMAHHAFEQDAPL
jgi:hypothetical protein